ncbi:UNVERIFIED_CONTAM: hypothetical protein GTU68_016222 [Idotea baltica]|nr:hypothetical protein [Idotea baltica]
MSETLDSLAEIQQLLVDGQLTCLQLVQNYLDQIRIQEDLNAYVEVYEDEARQRAIELDNIRMSNDRPLGRLWGAVFSIKDVISHKGHGLTAGSKILQGYDALYSATAIERLLKEDAIIIGRANCDEFAMGSDNETSFYGPVRNAINKERIAGGSSGGSAVSVQARTCLMSLGSDTGGSVRQPASFCGILGFKPSYGRVSRHGLIAYGSSFDQIGIMGRDLDDLKLTYEIIQGPDEYDGTLVKNPGRDETQESPPFRIAYVKEALEHPGLQPQIAESFGEMITLLRSAGQIVDEVSFDLLDYVIPSYYVLTAAEASSNLSRYDGIRYGYRAADVSQLDEMYTKSRAEGFGREVKRRIMLGTFVLSVGHYDAYFAKAQKIRRLIMTRFSALAKEYDVIMMPMTPTTAWEIGSGKSPVEIYLADIYSVLANLVGAPAISLPLGEDGDKMPYGLQLLAGNFREEKLFFLSQYMRSLIL